MLWELIPIPNLSNHIVASTFPEDCEADESTVQYNFAVLPEVGYGVRIDQVVFVANGTAIQGTTTFVTTNSSGYKVYYATGTLQGYYPTSVAVYVSTFQIASSRFSITYLKGTGVSDIAVYNTVTGSYIPATYADAGDPILFRVTFNQDVDPRGVIAQYIDSAGTVHTLTLTQPEPTTPAYTFTMPSGNVKIIANGHGQGSAPTSYDFPTSIALPITIEAKITNAQDRLDMVIRRSNESYFPFTIEPTFRDEILARMNYNNGFTRFEYDNYGDGTGDVYVRYKDMADPVETLPYVVTQYSQLGNKTGSRYSCRIRYSNGVITRNGAWEYGNDYSSEVFGFYYIVSMNNYPDRVVIRSTYYTNVTPAVSPTILVDYTLSPVSAGTWTVAPATLESSAPFNVTLTLNNGYQIKSVSATSVVTTQDDINEYTKATVTYGIQGNVVSIAVSNLLDELDGVNVVVECLNTNDPNKTPTTPPTGTTFDPDDPTTWPPGFDPATWPGYNPNDPSTWPPGDPGLPVGGDGDRDPSSDPVPPSVMPLLSAHNSGLCRIFRPSIIQLRDLGSYLWTNITQIVENIQKWFSNPLDYIISLNIVPCVPEVTEEEYIDLGLVQTTIKMPPVISQWVEVDCGTIQVRRFYGSALDYSPYTKISAMLPFIGSVPLDTDEVMEKNLHLIYRIDILSGHCVAMICVNNDVLYQFSGDCAAAITLTGADWSRVYGAIVGTGIGLALVGASGAGIEAAGNTAFTNELAKSEAVSRAAESLAGSSVAMKGIPGVTQMRALAMQNLENTMALDASVAATGGVSNAIRSQTRIHAISNTVGAVMGAKIQTGHAGSLSGNAGLIGTRKPYLLIEYPTQSLASDYKHMMGYPANVSGLIGSFRGYTVFEQVVPSIAATDDEIAEILDTLKGGVYL